MLGKLAYQLSAPPTLRTNKEESMHLGGSILAMLVLAALHVLCGRLRIIHQDDHSPWLSFAGGIAVAYVFMVLLPKLSDWQSFFIAPIPPEASVSGLPHAQALIAKGEGLQRFLIYEVFVSALAGLVVFYGLERGVHWSLDCQKGEMESGFSPPGLFWVHISVFAAYNFLIGYMVAHSIIPGPFALFLGVIGIGLHFLGINHGLWRNYQERFDHYGRWILAAALLAGWVLGVLTALAKQVYISMYSFLAGGIIMNVFNEELPSGPQARFWPFFFGVTGYSLLWLAIYALFK
jgi:hypothetical protein